MDEFVPEFTKDYTVQGFTIQVQYKGLEGFDNLGTQTPTHHKWWYKIFVDGKETISAPYKWACSERELSLENVANHVASFFDTDVALQDLVGAMKKEDRPEMLSEGNFIQMAIKAVWMGFYFRPPNKLEKEDVYVVWFSKTLQNWKALVSTNAKDDRYYEVTYDGDKQRAYVDAYTKVDQLVLTDEVLRYTDF